MRLEALKSALAELRQERAEIDSAIDAIERIINHGSAPTKQFVVPTVTVTMGQRNGQDKSYVDLTEEAILANGHDLKIDAIMSYIEKQRGRPTNRNSLEATLSSHMAKLKKRGELARIIKTAPSTYGLPKNH